MTLQQEREVATQDKKFVISNPQTDIDVSHNRFAEIERGMEWAARELRRRWAELTPAQQREYSTDSIYAFNIWAASGVQKEIHAEMRQRAAADEFSIPGHWENIN